MSYNLKKDELGAIYISSFELPLYEGNEEDLARQAQVTLTSCLRHLAVVDEYMAISNPTELNEPLMQHFEQAGTQLISCMMTLTSIADLYGIDIMQEVYAAPWEA